MSVYLLVKARRGVVEGVGEGGVVYKCLAARTSGEEGLPPPNAADRVDGLHLCF